MRESVFQVKLVNKLKIMFPGCFILRNDPSINQGIPDLLILFGDQWAMLEVKKERGASKQPNQDYFVEMFNEMSFAAIIHPQNEEQVLDELQSAFGSRR